MNRLLFLACLALSTLAFVSPSTSNACFNGDTRKTLLVIAVYQGEEEKVVGEIDAKSNRASVTSSDFWLASAPTADPVRLKSFSGETFSFSRANSGSGRFCFPAIYAN